MTAARGLVVVFASAACSRAAPADRIEHAGSVEPAAKAADAATSAVGDAGDDDAGERVLAGHPEIAPLVEGEEKLGFVSVPLGARDARPIVVALHGGSERPEVACKAWREVAREHAFVVCPHGWGGNERRLGWRGAKDTSERIARAVAATKKTFGAWVKDTHAVVLAGFSMGASQVALVARAEPKTYPRIVIGDSAHDPGPALRFAPDWISGGGQRALFLCSTSGCEPSMRAAAKRVKEKGAVARLNVAPTQKHGFTERVALSTRRDWSWLVEGLEGWDGYAQHDDPPPAGRTETFE